MNWFYGRGADCGFRNYAVKSDIEISYEAEGAVSSAEESLTRKIESLETKIASLQAQQSSLEAKLRLLRTSHWCTHSYRETLHGKRVGTSATSQ